MPISSGEAEIDAVLFDLDDVLVPFHTPAAWQWAWHPQGPALGERRLQAALKRALKGWDRRRWQGVTGRSPPADLTALTEHLTFTLREVAGRSLPPEEEAAVVRRMLRPAGEIERYPEVAPTLARLAARGLRCGTITPLPESSAQWILKRVGLPETMLLGSGDSGAPTVPGPRRVPRGGGAAGERSRDDGVRRRSLLERRAGGPSRRARRLPVGPVRRVPERGDRSDANAPRPRSDDRTGSRGSAGRRRRGPGDAAKPSAGSERI